MASHKTQPNAATKGGRRRTRVSVDATRRSVRALLGEGASRDEILAHVGARYGLAPRTARNYIAGVLDDLAASWAKERPMLRMTLGVRLRALSVAAEKRGAFSAAVRAEQLLGEVHGLLGVRSEAIPALAPASVADAPMTLEEADLRVQAVQQAIESTKAARARGQQP